MRKAAAVLAFLSFATVSRADVTVSVANMSFNPSSVTIAPGEKVTWQFLEPFHTTTSDSQSGAEVWDSGIVDLNGTFTHTFTTAGDYPYYCKIHSVPGGSAMNGVVHVVAAAIPTVTSVTPSAGSTAGGTAVVLTGSNFDASCSSVTFGGAAAGSFTLVSPTEIDAVTPAHAAGAVDVNVTCAGGVGTLPAGFTFGAPPAISSFAPLSGAPGSTVTIEGSGFVAGARVTFEGVDGAVTFVDGSTLTVIVPNAPAGAVTIVVINPDGQSATAAQTFNVLAASAIPAMSEGTALLLAVALSSFALVSLRRLV